MDGIFITASDSEIFRKARIVNTLCTTPRAGLNTINKSNVFLDGLIGSNLDPEKFFLYQIYPLYLDTLLKLRARKEELYFLAEDIKHLKIKTLKLILMDVVTLFLQGFFTD